MNLNQFRQLDEKEQLDLVVEHGVYIGKRKEKKTTIVLYQLDYYYIEIFYKEYRKYIRDLRIFTSTDELQPYFEQIDIAALISCRR